MIPFILKIEQILNLLYFVFIVLIPGPSLNSVSKCPPRKERFFAGISSSESF